MNRIDRKFEKLKSANQKGFVAYITAGDPTLKVTKELVIELEKRGVDIIELGVPFSDPLADGPVIQEASQRALKNKVSLKDVLDVAEELRESSQIPIVLFTYFNPVHRYGVNRFVKRCAEADIDGVLLLDLPPEEGNEYKALMDERGVKTVFLLSPTSTEERIALISKMASGFVYYVSRTGVTGERDKLEDSIGAMVSKIRDHTDIPVAVGFGISKPEQVVQVASCADAVVVGSAIVRRIGQWTNDESLVSKIGDYTETLTGLLKSARF